jgi:signal transduction histidine kinase
MSRVSEKDRIDGSASVTEQPNEPVQGSPEDAPTLFDTIEQHVAEPFMVLSRRRSVRIALVSVLTLLFVIAGAYAQLVLDRTSAYTHLAYIPIILVGFWWGRRSLFMAALFAAEVALLYALEPVPAELWSTLVRIGCFFAVAIVVSELSRRIMASQKSLREANLKFSHLSRLQRDFLHVTVHDLSSPVGAAVALLQGVETLMDDYRPPREKQLIERAIARLNEVSSFLRDFQFFAALDSTEIGQQATRTDLAAVISAVVSANAELASKRGHTVTLDLERGLPEVAAIGWLISEVVANLLTNAVKYTPEGGRIAIRAFSSGGRVHVEVRDNGIGISAEDQKLLFREFGRVRRKSRTGERVPGIGLGLSIVKRIVEMHGGRVHLESEPDRGSTFSFEIPACPPGVGPVSLPLLP